MNAMERECSALWTILWSMCWFLHCVGKTDDVDAYETSLKLFNCYLHCEERQKNERKYFPSVDL